MITNIVKDQSTDCLNSYKEIKEKLNYFRKISASGVESFSSEDFTKLNEELNQFFNIQFSLFADTFPNKLFRISNNKHIRGKREKLQHIKELTGPPKKKAGYGRCNIPGKSMFYAALDFQTAIWETQPQVGDYITVSEWSIKPDQYLNTHIVFNPQSPNQTVDSMGGKRAYSKFKEHGFKKFQKNNPDIIKILDEIFSFLSSEFMKIVSYEKKKNYLFSANYASNLMEFGESAVGPRIEAICYPSVKMGLGLTNIAILNELVMEKLNIESITMMNVLETDYNPDDLYSDKVLRVEEFQYTVTDFDFENDRIIYDPKEEMRQVIELSQKNHE